ncbi:MAG: hypothetical protein ABIP55_01205, partial [Tepidisphaeraceae bacterium]
MITRRTFLRTAAASTMASAIAPPLLAQAAPAAAADGGEKLILCAPLTHSDWMLKPNIAWGEA